MSDSNTHRRKDDADRVIRRVRQVPACQFLFSGSVDSEAIVRLPSSLADKLIILGVAHGASAASATLEDVREGRCPARAFILLSNGVPSRTLHSIREELKEHPNIELSPEVFPATTAVIRQLYSSYQLGGDTGDGSHVDDATAEASDRRQIELFDELWSAALAIGASDIHIEVGRMTATVSQRVHGILRPVTEMAADDALALCRSAYNFLSDQKSRRDPFNADQFQNSSIERTHHATGEYVRIRYASSPILSGFTVVMRLLTEGRSAGRDLSFEELGYAASQARQLREIFAQPHGLFLITGITGSGKSTTLKHGIRSVLRVRPGVSAFTIEEPVESIIEGARQIPVSRGREDADDNPFAVAFRQVMRLDPDVVMVGEIRDAKTAQLAGSAAVSGHQVLSTLHTVTALDAATRLTGPDLGVSNELLSSPSFMIGVANQSLLPVLCPRCRHPVDIKRWRQSRDPALREVADRLTPVAGLCNGLLFHRSERGCEHCQHLGTVGQTVAAEIVIPDDAMRSFWRNGDHVGARRVWSASRNAEDPDDFTGRTSQEHALRKMLDGVVSPVDVERTFGQLPVDLLKEYAVAYRDVHSPSRAVNTSGG